MSVGRALLNNENGQVVAPSIHLEEYNFQLNIIITSLPFYSFRQQHFNIICVFKISKTMINVLIFVKLVIIV